MTMKFTEKPLVDSDGKMIDTRGDANSLFIFSSFSLLHRRVRLEVLMLDFQR